MVYEIYIIKNQFDSNFLMSECPIHGFQGDYQTCIWQDSARGGTVDFFDACLPMIFGKFPVFRSLRAIY